MSAKRLTIRSLNEVIADRPAFAGACYLAASKCGPLNLNNRTFGVRSDTSQKLFEIDNEASA